MGYYTESRPTIAACNTSGTYTTQITGANQTPKTSQFHKADLVCSGNKTSHPAAKVAYSGYRINPGNLCRLSVDDNGANPERTRGIPRTTLRERAREKFSTVVTEIIVDAMQRLRALRTMETLAEEGDAG